MLIEILTATVIIIFAIVSVLGFFVLQKNRKIQENLLKREEDAKQKIYEIAVLNKIAEKIDYSLNIQSAIEIIIGSLSDFTKYACASYMLLFPEKIIFGNYIGKTIPHKYITEIKEKMTNSLSALVNENFNDKKIEENNWGLDFNDELIKRPESYFDIPLMISGKTVGLLSISDESPSIYGEKEKDVLRQIVQQATQAVAQLQKVVESENGKMNAMVSSMTEGVIMTDMDYNILVINPAAEKAAGFFGKNNLSINDFTKVLADKIDLKDKIEEAIRLDKIFLSDEIPLMDSFFKIAIAPVRDKWRTLGCVIIFHDITKDKEVQRIKEDFTSMIVHELRSPLDSIKKIVEMMRMSESNKAKRAECYQMIYSSSSDMLELVNNLLDMAKIEAGKFEIMKQKSDIKKVIEGRISFFEIASKDAKVKITSQFGKNIPEAVEFDSHTISQVLNNFISNAIKFNKKNGSIVVQALLHKKGEDIEKEAKDSGINWFIGKDIGEIPDSLLIAVTDSGLGIAPEQTSKLFNKFIQAKIVFSEKGGTGLGLAIAKSIIESHQGIVGVKSIEGQGSTFYFTLPINNNETINK